MAELKTLFGAMVRRHRTQKGLSQVELAQRTSRSLETIARVERGENAPSFETVEAIAHALDVPVASLFGADASSDPEGRLTQLMIKLAALDDAHLVWIDRLIADALGKPR
jgi:transcriptional regulator with XRE-family HTH domain